MNKNEIDSIERIIKTKVPSESDRHGSEYWNIIMNDEKYRVTFGHRAVQKADDTGYYWQECMDILNETLPLTEPDNYIKVAQFDDVNGAYGKRAGGKYRGETYTIEASL